MRKSARSLLVLLTMLAAVAAGVLNGRVVCMASGGHVALEEPHGEQRHAPHDHGCDGSGDPENHQAPDKDGCTDIASGGTLVHEATLTTYSHEHVQLALFSVPTALTVIAHAATPRSTESPFAGAPPAQADLSRLRSIILQV
jgi:hypothetical protein